MPLPWPPLLRHFLSRRPGTGAQACSREETSSSASLEAGVVFSRARKEGGTTFSFHPHPHCISQHPLLTRGYNLKCLQGQTGNIHEQSKRWYGAIGTGGACGKLKSKVSSSKGQSWPMVAKQIGKDGDPVLPNLLAYQKKPPFFFSFFILNVGPFNDLKGPNSSSHCLCFHLLLHSSRAGHAGLFTVWEPHQTHSYLRTFALLFHPPRAFLTQITRPVWLESSR